MKVSMQTQSSIQSAASGQYDKSQFKKQVFFYQENKVFASNDQNDAALIYEKVDRPVQQPNMESEDDDMLRQDTTKNSSTKQNGKFFRQAKSEIVSRGKNYVNPFLKQQSPDHLKIDFRKKTLKFAQN